MNWEEQQRIFDRPLQPLPHSFQVRAEELPVDLSPQRALLSMVRLQGTGLYRIYAALSSLQDEDQSDAYRRGFAMTVVSLQQVLASRGQQLPNIAGDDDSIAFYERGVRETQADIDTQYGLKLALNRDERPLLEAFDAAYYGMPQRDFVPFSDGVLDAYMVIGEAAKLRKTAALAYASAYTAMDGE